MPIQLITKSRFVQHVAPLLAVLLVLAALLGEVACGTQQDTPAIEGSPTPIPTSNPTPTTAQVDNIRWLLQSLDGRPLIVGSFVTLRLNDNRLGGFDGCNTFSGRHEDRTMVAAEDGTFTMPSAIASTVQGCIDPKGVLDQADAYFMALRQSTNYRSVGDRLETLDETGRVRLIFHRQYSLPGTPARLEGTSWRLLTGDDSDDGVQSPTLTFLDSHLYEGTTACRAVDGSYEVSGKSIRFPSIGMTGDHSTCSRGVMMLEAQFTDDLSYSIEYSVYREDGEKRLVLRTSRCRTLTFESTPEQR